MFTMTEDDCLVFEAAMRALPAGESENSIVAEGQEFETFIKMLYHQLTHKNDFASCDRGTIYNMILKMIFLDEHATIKAIPHALNLKKFIAYTFAYAIKKWREKNPKRKSEPMPYLTSVEFSTVSLFVKAITERQLCATHVSSLLQWAVPIIHESADPKKPQDYREIWRKLNKLPTIELQKVRINFFDVLAPFNKNEFSDPPILRIIADMAQDIPQDSTMAASSNSHSYLSRYRAANGRMGLIIPLLFVALIIAYAMALFIPAALDRNHINSQRSFGEPAVSIWQVIQANALYIRPTYMPILLAVAGLFFLMFIFLVTRALSFHRDYEPLA